MHPTAFFKGNYWILDPQYAFEEMFEGGNFQRRRRSKRNYDRASKFSSFHHLALHQGNGRNQSGQ